MYPVNSFDEIPKSHEWAGNLNSLFGKPEWLRKSQECLPVSPTEQGQCPSSQPRDALPPDFQLPSGSPAKSCGPPNETRRFCLTFAVLSDETMMDYFIVVTSMPDFFFQTHNRNIHLLLLRRTLLSSLYSNNSAPKGEFHLSLIHFIPAHGPTAGRLSMGDPSSSDLLSAFSNGSHRHCQLVIAPRGAQHLPGRCRVGWG